MYRKYQFTKKVHFGQVPRVYKSGTRTLVQYEPLKSRGSDRYVSDSGYFVEGDIVLYNGVNAKFDGDIFPFPAFRQALQKGWIEPAGFWATLKKKFLDLYTPKGIEIPNFQYDPTQGPVRLTLEDKPGDLAAEQDNSDIVFDVQDYEPVESRIKLTPCTLDAEARKLREEASVARALATADQFGLTDEFELTEEF